MQADCTSRTGQSARLPAVRDPARDEAHDVVHDVVSRAEKDKQEPCQTLATARPLPHAAKQRVSSEQRPRPWRRHCCPQHADKRTVRRATKHKRGPRPAPGPVPGHAPWPAAWCTTWPAKKNANARGKVQKVQGKKMTGNAKNLVPGPLSRASPWLSGKHLCVSPALLFPICFRIGAGVTPCHLPLARHCLQSHVQPGPMVQDCVARHAKKQCLQKLALPDRECGQCGARLSPKKIGRPVSVQVRLKTGPAGNFQATFRANFPGKREKFQPAACAPLDMTGFRQENTSRYSETCSARAQCLVTSPCLQSPGRKLYTVCVAAC